MGSSVADDQMQHMHHPQMKGSWSLKSILPTIAPEMDYRGLDEVQVSTPIGIFRSH